jgi:hypothetical protein
MLSTLCRGIERVAMRALLPVRAVYLFLDAKPCRACFGRGHVRAQMPGDADAHVMSPCGWCRGTGMW